METTTQLLSSLATFVFFASLKATVLVVLVLSLQKVSGKLLSANGRYLLWLSVVLSLVTPFGFDTALPPPITFAEPNRDISTSHSTAITERSLNRDLAFPQAAFPATNPDTGIDHVESVNLDTANIDNANNAATHSNQADWLQILSYLWLAGIFAAACVVGISSYRFTRMVRQSRPATAAMQMMLKNCKTQISCNTPIKLQQSSSITSPLITGLWKPVLLWPEGLESELTDEQIVHVFIHELMHIKRLDIVSNCVLTFLQIVYWFNPILWYAFGCMRQDLEMACDESTLKQLNSPNRRAYAQTLILLGSVHPEQIIPTYGLGFGNKNTQLHRRIIMLARSSFSQKIQAAFTIAFFVPLAVIAFTQPVTASAQDQEAGIQAMAAAMSNATIEQGKPLYTEPQKAVPTTIAIPPQSMPIELNKPQTFAANEQIALAKAEAATAAETQDNPAYNNAQQSPPNAKVADSRPDITAEAASANPLQAASSHNAASPLQNSQLAAATELKASPSTQASQPTPQSSQTDTNGKVCRELMSATSGHRQRVCDTEQAWAEFARKIQEKSGEDIAENVLAENAAIEIDYKICRSNSITGSQIKRKVCNTPETWAAIETNSKNKSSMLRMRMHEYSNSFSSGEGIFSGPSAVEASNDAMNN